MRNKVKHIREFDTGEIVVVRIQVKSRRNVRVAQKLLFKTKLSYRVLYKDTPISYWFQRLTFCEGIGSSGRKVKGPATSM